MGIAFVILWVIGGIIYTAWRFLRWSETSKTDAKVVIGYLACLFVWGWLTALIASRDGYVKTTEYFAMNVATFVPLIVTGCFLVFATSRRVFERWIASISLQELTWIHLVRLTAIGTILKMLRGSLPAHFILPVGIPDFVLGLSVSLIVWLVFRRGIAGKKVLVVWNVVGFVLFFPTLVVLYLSVPSPLQIFFEAPNTYEVFEFPMALVPTFIAPLFILIHNAAIIKLLRPGVS
ncbi:MAG: hypothetical protein V3T61_10820 [Acidobacteriota bacterium]